MRSAPVSVVDERLWNDTFAREFDIDAYYTRSSVLVRWVTRARMRAIVRLIAARPADRILEVGCGGGHLLRMFPHNELAGVDISGEMIQKAKRNLRGYNVTLHCGRLPEIEGPTSGFDRILCSEVLEHVVDPAALIAQMAQRLAPKGRLVVTIPNDRWIDALKAIVRRSGLHHVPPFRNITWGGDQYHLHAWTKRDMMAELSRCLTVDRVIAAPSAALPLHFAFACSRREN